MEKTVGAFEARGGFGKILQDVVSHGEKVIVERHGEPIAVVVPIQLYEQWKQRRAAFFDKLRQMAEQSALSPDEADALAAEAVSAVRRTSSTN
jgi:prevent-host-death family protein